MKTIYKYKIWIGGNVELMPQGAVILHVENQYNDLCLWALVDEDLPKEPRYFEVYGTGQEINKELKLKFLGSALMMEGHLVWHVFERFNSTENHNETK